MDHAGVESGWCGHAVEPGLPHGPVKPVMQVECIEQRRAWPKDRRSDEFLTRAPITRRAT